MSLRSSSAPRLDSLYVFRTKATLMERGRRVHVMTSGMRNGAIHRVRETVAALECKMRTVGNLAPVLFADYINIAVGLISDQRRSQ